ncbi:DoxX family protein [Pontibacter diazotrophicus]|uniref:DoxX family protein n=1 Tax=Pontibacter diazotrophicus TaxID=1400979 RepID=A0A3D8LEZ2_9BACT|nr:DoxX family protein [Pontibacter diazotrophicus]RDV15985.1 DoxX family protein [Pontibacter diazotrophicus]
MDASVFSFFRRHSAYGVLFLRFAIGVFIIYGVQDNVFSWARMMEFRDFLQLHGVPYPLIAAHLSVYVQFICGILLLIGGAVRLVGVLFIINFTAAIFIAHIGQSFPQYYPAAQLIALGFFFLFNGAGPLSLDAYIARTRKEQHTKLPVNEPSVIRKI